MSQALLSPHLGHPTPAIPVVSSRCIAMLVEVVAVQLLHVERVVVVLVVVVVVAVQIFVEVT